MMQAIWKRYGLDLVRWQLSTPILAGVLLILASTDKIVATVVANLIGGLIFFWIDRFIFKSDYLAVQWEVKEFSTCVDCGRTARGYRIAQAKQYNKTKDANPEFRCEECSRRKAEELRSMGIEV